MIFDEIEKNRCDVNSVRFLQKYKLIAIFIAFLIIACSEGKPDRSGIVIANSSSYEATIYRQNCAICHGREAYGKKVDGKLVPSLRFGEASKKTEEEIYRQIAYGNLAMPSFKDQLTEKEIRRMVIFIIRDLQDRDIEAEKKINSLKKSKDHQLSE